MSMPDPTFRYCPLCATELAEKAIAGVRRLACPACDFVQFRGPGVVALVVLHHEGLLLLGRRNIEPGKGLWNFCGGYVELGETVEAAAIREVKEEANLDITLERLVGIYSTDEGSHLIVAYQARIPSDQMKRLTAQQAEVSELELFAWEDLPPLAFPVHREILHDWKLITG
jgi:ADP-ribose pyrophosphatase YjhB (NUDIX family)